MTGSTWPARAWAGLLLLAGLLVGVAAVVGAADAADGGPRGGVPVAAFLAALPGLVALGVGFYRPTAGLAVTAAAGWWGVARVLADLALIGDPASAVRPELFAETSARSQPFGIAAGAWLLIAADLLWIAAGVLATRAVAPRLLPDRPASGVLFGDPAPLDRAVDDPAFDPAADPAADPAGDRAGDRLGDRSTRDGRVRWSLPVVAVGLIGVVLVAVGALDPGYVGGFLDLRALPPGTTLLGVLGTGLAVIVAGALVLVAAATRRSLAVPLLVGSAVAAAVPFLVVLAVVAGGSSIGSPGVSVSVWWGLAGAVLLGLAGLLAPRDEAAAGAALLSPDSADAPSPPQVPADRDRSAPAAGALALLSGLLSAGAAVVPVLLVGGRTPTGVPGELVAPIGPPFATAAVPLLVAGALTLLVPTRRAGLVAATVVWAGPVLALIQALEIRGTVGDVVGSAQAASRLSDQGPTWSDGAGFWLAWAAVVLAVTAAVVAAVAARRLTDAGTAVPDEASVVASRPVRVGLAAALTVLTIAALSVPIYATLGRGAAPTLVSGYDVDIWGRWAIAVAVLIGVWTAARTVRVDVAVAAPVAAAVAAVQPLIVPAAVRAQVGFEWRAGLWLLGALIVLLLAAAPLFGRQAARIGLRPTRPITA